MEPLFTHSLSIAAAVGVMAVAYAMAVMRQAPNEAEKQHPARRSRRATGRPRPHAQAGPAQRPTWGIAGVGLAALASVLILPVGNATAWTNLGNYPGI